MNIMGNTMDQRVKEIFDTVVKHRRHLHQNPELSFQEYQTSVYIQEELTKLGIPFQVVMETGVVAVLEGRKETSDAIVVLRADIDALPIFEKNEVSYKSNNDGIMHACGHDFHTANLLGAATLLVNMLDTFSGKIILLFQPAEERIPGGAKQIVESRVLESFEGTIKAVLGLHVSPRLPLGTIGIKPGRFMASSDEFYIRIKGKGGHAAEPHRAVDPVMIGVQLLNALQQIVSRKADPSIPSVLTFGRFIGDGAANVIPQEVLLEGTFRTMDEPWRKEALHHIETLIANLPVALGAEVTCEVRHGYPVLQNDPHLAQELTRVLRNHLDQIHVVDPGIWMAAEDFAYYSHQYPSLFLLLGTSNTNASTQYGLHNAQFDLDENAFHVGIPVLIQSVLHLLNTSNG
ncbi:M20 metallopeptidase family protein [Sphingobacterium psychroaquaticum]|nr:M20 family metallopeptidase [Sphingobacterium psychroaquaticum]